MITMVEHFASALPVWIAGEEADPNRALLLRVNAPKGPKLLRIAGHSGYQVFWDGHLIACGPARAAHGYHYVDEIPLTSDVLDGEGVLAVIAYSGGVDCYAYAHSHAFICAELIQQGMVIAATGCTGFSAERFDVRLQKVPRFSFQRAFTEAYRITSGDTNRLTASTPNVSDIRLSVQPEKFFLRKTSPYPEYERSIPESIVAKGECCLSDILPDHPWARHECFAKEILEADPWLLAKRLRIDATGEKESGNYILWDYGRIITGFFELEVEIAVPSLLLLTFDEILTHGQIDFERLSCVNSISWELGPGTHRLTTMEPNTLRYACAALLGKGKILSIDLCRYEFPKSRIMASPVFPDPVHAVIYKAALETFRQNAVDIFMDCPSRERAGWLCDSFFTGRAEYVITGRNDVERAFLLNYILPARFDFLPPGMLPMCYPADHPNGNYIPNWAMWFVLELEEYYMRTGDREMVDAARTRVEALIEFFKGYENEYGLLERLDKWIFVEWSKANDLVQDVNFPSNMLYCAMLRAAARLYGDTRLEAKASKLETVIRSLSLTKEHFYCDNAIHTQDGLKISGVCTETCQYYAFFTGIATPEADQMLLEILLKKFGPKRDAHTSYPDIAPSNAFIGDYLRLELLLSLGKTEEMMDEIIHYFAPMAYTTGTLWENNGSYASCDHGFASSVVYYMQKAFPNKSAP